MAPWETTRDLVAAKAIPTKAPTATVSRFPFARIVPSRNTPTKRARPSCKEESRCARSEEHTSELQSLRHLVCRLLLEKKKKLRWMPVYGREIEPRTRMATTVS